MHGLCFKPLGVGCSNEPFNYYNYHKKTQKTTVSFEKLLKKKTKGEEKQLKKKKKHLNFCTYIQVTFYSTCGSAVNNVLLNRN